SFGLKLSPNGFAISLTRSNHRRNNARWAHSSKRNEADREQWWTARCAVRTPPARRPYLALLTRPRHRNHEFAVLLGYEVFGTAGGAAACILFLNLDDKLFRRFEI